MEVVPKDGQIKQAKSFEKITVKNETKSSAFGISSKDAYKITGAIFLDQRDYRDYMPYFYAAFNKGDDMFLVRVLSTNEYWKVDWTYKFVHSTTKKRRMLSRRERELFGKSTTTKTKTAA